MHIELDHLFICTNQGAPEAEELVRFGLHEGPPNQHPGQGTANRRFAFYNAMIELLWVSDSAEARNESTRPTQLWERWSGRDSGACPFGIVVRPVDPAPVDPARAQTSQPPFPSWEYRPAYLPDPLVMHIGEAGVDEPMWVYLNFMRRAAREQWFVEHPAGIREITALTLTSPAPLSSTVSERMISNGVLSSLHGSKYLLEIEFDRGGRNQVVDFRPRLPLIFRL
jgi:hypothetical protein